MCVILAVQLHPAGSSFVSPTQIEIARLKYEGEVVYSEHYSIMDRNIIFIAYVLPLLVSFLPMWQLLKWIKSFLGLKKPSKARKIAGRRYSPPRHFGRKTGGDEPETSAGIPTVKRKLTYQGSTNTPPQAHRK